MRWAAFVSPVIMRSVHNRGPQILHAEVGMSDDIVPLGCAQGSRVNDHPARGWACGVPVDSDQTVLIQPARRSRPE